MTTKNIKQLLFTCLVGCLCLTLLTSCNDIVKYNDGYIADEDIPNAGAPVITGVYDVSDTHLTTPITQGDLEQTVIIVGMNLNDVQSVKFNTVECDMSNVYTMSTKAIVQIPGTLSMEHVNQIEYTTPQGTASYDFLIPFPDLIVTGLDCEFKTPGQPVTVMGRNFDIYDFGHTSKVSMNGTVLPVSEVTSKSMTFTVPEETTDNSKIVLSWEDAEGNGHTATLFYRPTTHLLYGDFEDAELNIDGPLKNHLTIEDDGSVWNTTASLGYKHLHFTGSYSAWSWNTIDIVRNMVEVEGDLSNLDDYVLKFEVQNAKNFPLSPDTHLEFAFNWGNSYNWNIGDGAGINTYGDWQTVTLPLADMATKGISKPGSWQIFRIIFQPKVAMDVDFCLGNFRIEKK